MKEQLITFETAKLAKEKEFDLQSPAYYSCDEPVSKKEGNQLCIRTWIKYTDIGLEMIQKGTMIYSAPTQSLLQKWLREKHYLFVKTHPVYRNDKIMYEFIIFLLKERLRDTDGFKNIMSLNIEPYYWDEDEEALEKGLQEALKLI